MLQPLDDDLSRCVHCGLCLNFCPTYRATGLETESPRGRIYLMKSVKEGRIDINESFHQHMDLCLVCRACETACPSGVPFGRLMESSRVQLWDKPVGSFKQRLALHLAFEALFPFRRRFRLAFRLLQFYQRSGLQRMLRLSGLLRHLAPTMAQQEALMPSLDTPFFDVQATVPPRIPSSPRVGFVAGCIMSTAFGDVQRATVNVLERVGCQVVVPPGQGCCGALNVHAGERRMAKRMARALIECMLAVDVDVVLINSAGCGSTMKEYHELFVDEPQYLPRVREFERKVKDFSEFLAEHIAGLPEDSESRSQLRVFSDLPRPEKSGLTGAASSPENEATVVAVYQDACHLRHAQQITTEPRQILGLVPNIRLVELAYPDQCCGSAGIYNLEHPDLSNRILSAKLDDIRASGAELVISANPGCILQIQKGLTERGLNIPVKHIAVVLDEALTGRTTGGR